MFYDPKKARILVFRPEKRADLSFSTRKTRGSMFYDPKNVWIHVFRPEKHVDPCFSTRKMRGSMFYEPKNARIQVYDPPPWGTELGWDRYLIRLAIRAVTVTTCHYSN